jgi:hypothetical protein
MSSSENRIEIVHSSPNPTKKRRKGATRLSCAECRRSVTLLYHIPSKYSISFHRLKLRCDRSIPCGSCVKRGCGAICPDVSLSFPSSPLCCNSMDRALLQRAKAIGIHHVIIQLFSSHPSTCLSALFLPQHKNFMKRSLN